MVLLAFKTILKDKLFMDLNTSQIELTENQQINGKKILSKVKLNYDSNNYILLKMDKIKFCNFILNDTENYHKQCDYAILFIHNNMLKIILCELKSTNINQVHKMY